MGWLSQSDIQSVLAALRGLYESADVDGFASRAAAVMLRLVPADRCSYNEFREPGKVRVLISPQGKNLGGPLQEAMAAHGHENPALSYFRRSGRAEVVSFSDFVTRQQLHRLPLYNEYYRHVDVEHQVVVPLSLGSERTREVGFALSRRQTDFSERDRQVLEMLQPHLVQAHANAISLELLGVKNACLEGVLDASGRCAVILSDNDTILFGTNRSREILRMYFGARKTGRDQLPESLALWVEHETTVLAGTSPASHPRVPMIVAQDGRRLTVRLMMSDDKRLLLLEEDIDAIDPQALASLGLTRRQSEVLAWVAQGKTNEEIATISGARPATVAKHLERIYQKLGVETRTAAAIEALGVARRAAFG
jgi:DNA-binding CsgD family transcriptional regulator